MFTPSDLYIQVQSNLAELEAFPPYVIYTETPRRRRDDQSYRSDFLLTMRFCTSTIAYLASALALAVLPQVAHAGITAFSGNTCDGAAGLNVPCDGSCHQFNGRHSFRVRNSRRGPHPLLGRIIPKMC